MFFLHPVILIKKDTSQSLVKVTYCMQHFSNHLVHVKPHFLKIHEVTILSFLFFFFDNLFHLDVRHTTEERSLAPSVASQL